MPVFALDHRLIFPHPVLREEEGLLGVGGDLSEDRLMLAYRWGIFPWYTDDQPLLWWWTVPRLVLKPQEVHVSRSLARILRKEHFRVTFDQDFHGVITRCSTINRKGQKGTWILPEMIDAYIKLHEAGHAHSVEVWNGDNLVGGVYGVVVGKIFSGESMFALEPNASKVAFVTLASHLASKGFEWIDCQQDTPHSRTMGGYLIEEDVFLEILRETNRFIFLNPGY